MECQLLYLLDYDLRIDETELVHHFSPFFRKSTLPSSSTTPAAKQQVMRGMPYAPSTEDVISVSASSTKRTETATLVSSASVPASLARKADYPSHPSSAQGTKRSIFTRSASASVPPTVRRIATTTTSSGATSSDEASSSCAELTEDHSSSDDCSSSSATSDDEMHDDEGLAHQRNTASKVRVASVANGAGGVRARFVAPRSVSTTALSTGKPVVSLPMTPTSSSDSMTDEPVHSLHNRAHGHGQRIGGMVKSVSYYDARRSPLAGRGAASKLAGSWV